MEKARKRSLARRALRLESLESRRVLATVLLNEVVADLPGTDNPFEYVELKGTPGATLPNGLYFVSMDGDGGAQGAADLVIDLSGVALGSNGLLVMKANAAGNTIPPETTVIVDEAFNAGVLENGTNSFLLVLSPNSPIVQGTDYDVQPDGVLELPSGAVIIDSVGWSDGNSGDFVYGGVSLTQLAGFPPGAATRFLHDNRASTVGGWYSGDLTGTNANASYTTVANSRSANFPTGGAITPGQINVPGGPNNAPVAVADSYNVEPNVLLTTNISSGVLGNDSDPDGMNSVLSVVMITQPSNATSFVINENGSFSYLNNGTLGADTFTYQATDLNLFSNIVTVTIQVAASTNVAPVITTPTGPIVYVENGPAAVIASTATVVDSDSSNFASGSLEVTIASNVESTDLLEVRNVGVGSGQVSVVGSNVSFEGVVIGVLSGGNGTTPLTIDLNSAATPVATEALIRNITFRTVSDAPSNLDRVIRFVVTDGDGGPEFGISNAALTTVTVASANDDPSITSTRSAVYYAANGPAVTLDGLLGLTDVDLMNFEAGVLTASISVGLESGDVLSIRSAGTGAGQISVAGNVVSFAGSAIGTVSGGTNGSPLLVVFNAAASLDSVRATARAVAFATTSTRLAPAARTVSLSLTDGDGGTSNTLAYSIIQSQTRRFGFQEGVDNGQGSYVGAADIQLAESQPDTPLPAGGNPTTEGLLVDFDGGFLNSQVLLRFDDIVGTGAGQIPAGSTIVSARLVVATLNGGDGGTLHRMLTSWDANTETWNSFGNGVAPRNTLPAIQADDIEARTAFDAQIGNAAGNSDPAAIPTIIGVTADVQAWVNGSANLGWLMQGWTGRSDGWAFLASETTDPSLRPKLEVEWLPASISSTAFRQGENGYSGNVDVALQENTPTVNASTGTTLSVDYNDLGATNNSQVLIRFDDIVGANASQIPAGALVHSAVLMLTATGSNAQGDGGTFHALLQPFDATTVTWDTFGLGAPGAGGGVTPDGIDAKVTPSATAGSASLNPNAEAGFNAYDITSDVQAWSNGSLANHGLAILPWTNGSDGWVFSSSESGIASRPQLRVFFTPVGTTVSPTSGLVTTEAGGTASFSLVLNTPPTADVTIGLTSSNPGEGTPSVSSITFTATNWDIPQIVTVTGVSDGVTDGDKAYQIVTGAAVSSDVNYSGLNLADVDLINNDVTTSATPVLVITSGNAVYNNAVYVPSASITGNNEPLPTLSFEFYSDAAGTNVIAAPENVGTYFVRARSAANAGNNAAESTIATFDITPFALTASGTAANKVYDSLDGASVTIVLANVFAGDTVTGTASGTFANKNVANGKTVTIGTVTLVGTDAGNYTVGSAGTTTADVTPATLVASVTADNKPFDDNTAATIASRSLSGILGTDVVTIAGGSATFADAGVGNGKIVTATGLTIDGADALNYTFNSSATTSANITATVFTRRVFYNGSGYENNAGANTPAGVNAALDTSKVLIRSGATTQVTGFDNVSNYSRGINGVVLDIAGLTASSLSASDFIFRVAPAGTRGNVIANPSSWPSIPSPLIPAIPTPSINVTAGTATTPGRVRLEWPDNVIQNTWLQIIVKANPSTTGLSSPQTFYMGHAMADVNGATGADAAYRVLSNDLTTVQQGIAAGTVSVNDVRDVNKDRRILSSDYNFVQPRVSANILLRNIQIPAEGSANEGSAGSGGGNGGGSSSSDGGELPVTGPLVGAPAVSLMSAQSGGSQETVKEKLGTGGGAGLTILNMNPGDNRSPSLGSSVSTVAVEKSAIDPSNEIVDDLFAGLAKEELGKFFS